MNLAIVSMEKKVLEMECDSVTLPTSEGQITILPGHIPLFSLLTAGEVIVRNKEEETSLAVGEGFVNFSKGRLILLTDFGVHSGEIDEAAIREAKARAEEILSQKSDNSMMAEAQANLARSILQLKIAGKRSRARK
ncbi:ATP synthase F1 subunit epsilon [Candidatus Amesbacteria bacterium RIFOXYB1_FULL_44_23]|uniref:ATP synthase epsilon chain n=1 Tax=Candidatus Amesbacteria bacterium RIFOXYB1_FULL_44_23 TaxID=1797263 RepID=A0A1F4ZRX7_9BACT|nr:MAG: ATP synthase F1 subunit epsilon [Candidatus Amesbacteria bacterium RIFOXYB1_FULL_44_23]